MSVIKRKNRSSIRRRRGAPLEPPSEAVAIAMRQVAAPAGEGIADHAARVLSQRLSGER
ncbi:MAG TPA: hypothetical protein PLO33_03785 [Kouleothrix sp.]|uniref:hypothetical protein n=1 Tax=Kouleothrix sp. TaxID=2779161 RepID=UPI002B7CC155|nr:hypothetical protein [Kouleothrix sp.]HRC74772.1 hypothetical protein [Kouleothrix sp.]